MPVHASGKLEGHLIILIESACCVLKMLSLIFSRALYSASFWANNFSFSKSCCSFKANSFVLSLLLQFTSNNKRRFKNIRFFIEVRCCLNIRKLTAKSNLREMKEQRKMKIMANLIANKAFQNKDNS